MTTAMPPPPPPPPPPAIEDQPSTANEPSFIQQWLEKERAKSPSPTNTQNERKQFFEKQCLFPSHIPADAMCDMQPMLALISQHVEKSNGDDSMGNESKNIINMTTDQTVPTHRTPLDDVRKLASLCATYKSRAVSNHKEFQYKRAIKLNEKKQLEEAEADQSPKSMDTGAPEEADLSNKKLVEATQQLPTKPPYSEYTSNTLGENFLMTKIHSANYNLCLSNAVCPTRTKQLMTCWESMDPRWIQVMKQQGMEEYICLEERGAVERCVGLGVQRVMKDILG